MAPLNNNDDVGQETISKSDFLIHLNESDMIDYSVEVSESSWDGDSHFGVFDVSPPPMLQSSHLNSVPELVPQTEAHLLLDEEEVRRDRRETRHGCNRPEFLHAQILKKKPTTPVGIVLTQRDDCVYIKRIDRNSLIRRTNLRMGDQLLAVNGVLTRTAEESAKLIRKTTRVLSLTCRSPCGSPNLVSTCIEKPSLKSMLGISFRNYNDVLIVSRVSRGAALPLLAPGHRCVSVNGRRVQDARAAATITGSAERFVTLVSRPAASYALVLAAEKKAAAWWKQVGVVPARVATATAF